MDSGFEVMAHMKDVRIGGGGRSIQITLSFPFGAEEFATAGELCQEDIVKLAILPLTEDEKEVLREEKQAERLADEEGQLDLDLDPNVEVDE